MNSCINMNEASLQHKANESVGCLRWTPWWLPLVIPGSPFETCFCEVIIIKALLSDNFVPFGKTDLLETLTYKVEQWWTVWLLLHQSDTKAWDDDDVGSRSHVTFFSPGCLITWWNHLIVWTTFDSGNAIFPIGLKKIFLIIDDVINIII